MKLYVKEQSGRYREASIGVILAAAIEQLRDISPDLAFEMAAMILDKVGYFPPAEVDDAARTLEGLGRGEEEGTSPTTTGVGNLPDRSRDTRIRHVSGDPTDR